VSLETTDRWPDLVAACQVKPLKAVAADFGVPLTDLVNALKRQGVSRPVHAATGAPAPVAQPPGPTARTEARPRPARPPTASTAEGEVAWRVRYAPEQPPSVVLAPTIAEALERAACFGEVTAVERVGAVL
jgi:hypothetical protein